MATINDITTKVSAVSKAQKEVMARNVTHSIYSYLQKEYDQKKASDTIAEIYAQVTSNDGTVKHNEYELFVSVVANDLNYDQFFALCAKNQKTEKRNELWNTMKDSINDKDVYVAIIALMLIIATVDGACSEDEEQQLANYIEIGDRKFKLDITNSIYNALEKIL